MTRQTADILIAGGGLAGLIAANAFARHGFSVICADPDPDRADLRTTAFLQPSARVLDRAGLWSLLAPYASALQVMRLADAGGDRGVLRYVADFDAAEISDQPFGWNLQNARVRDIAKTALPSGALRQGVGVERVTSRRDHALVRLSDGAVVAARLVVAADGRNSARRRALGISVRQLRYGQKALVFSIAHERPHGNVSTEIHRSGGPFTLVPLPDVDGRYTSSVVWMERGDAAAQLMSLGTDAFEAAVAERACNVLGQIKVVSERQVWPILGQLAKSLHGPRTALVAEAAHVVPPIGAQGLNMSLGDIEVLLDLAAAEPDALGTAEMLNRYTARRLPEISARVLGVDLLNRASMVDAQNLKDLRLQGLRLLHGVVPMRRSAMQTGLGV